MKSLIPSTLRDIQIPNIYHNTKYLEVCSANRDREQYPNQAQFVVNLGNSGGQYNSFSSVDPVFFGVTLFPPVQQTFPTTYPNYTYMYGTTLNGSLLPSDYIVSVLPVSLMTYRDIDIKTPSNAEHAYTNAVLELINNNVSSSSTASHEFRTITDYTVLESEQYIEAKVDTGVATNPILTTSVPLGTISCDIDHVLEGFTIEFTDTTDANLNGVTRKIVYYRAFDQRVFFDSPIVDATITDGDQVVLKIPSYQLTLKTPFSTGALAILGSNLTEANNTTARIRKEIPLLQDTLSSGTTTTFTLPASAGTRDFKSNVIWITSDPIVLSGSIVSANFTSDGTTQLSGSFVLSNASQFADDFFAGMSINITSGSFSGYSYVIDSWVQSTQTGTIVPGWTSVIAGTTDPADGSTFEIIQPNPSQYRLITSYNTSTRVGTVNAPFSYTNQQNIVTNYAVGSSDTFDILQFEKDNYQNLDVSQSMVTGQEDVCYALELVTLTIPNTTVFSTFGGSLTQYPYFYVEFRSLPAQTNTNNIWSNNPTAKKAMFRAVFFYNNNQFNQFALLDGHGMVQTLKMSMNSSYLFSIYLPNGELLKIADDYTFPSEPNPLLQISACFSMRKI